MNSLIAVEKFLGGLLGQAIGDGLGAPYEGLTQDHLYWSFSPPSDLVKNPSGDMLRYTDDTQMMIGVAETLIEHGEIRESSLCEAFAANYDPDRGYGPGARVILDAMIAGEDWRSVARTIFPGGSLGNGAAMRVAPVGLCYCDDLDRVSEQAELSALPTHLHPWGIEGARLLAIAVALAAASTGEFDRTWFYRELISRCRSEEFQWQLEAASRMRARHSVSVLGNGLEAHRSVVTAIACFTTSFDSYEGAIARAIGLGNDTDTLAAMAGALSGAFLGLREIPSALLDQLEDQSKGKHYLESLAFRLHERYRSRVSNS